MSGPELPDTPSRRQALSRLGRKQAPANLSSTSLNVSSTEDEVNENGESSAPLDGNSDKDKLRAKRSIEIRRDRAESDDSTRKRLSNLVTGRKKNRPPDIGLGLHYGTGNDAGDARNSNQSLQFEANRSESSLLGGSGRSSLLTDDNSDVEGKPVRPTLSPHDSHTGYLTLSSPEITAESNTVASTSSNSTSSEPSQPLKPVPSIPQIIEPTESEPPTSKSTTRRSPSPAGRLRGSFTLPRKSSTGDTDSLKSQSGIGGLRGVFRSSRRGSVNPEEPKQPSDVEVKSTEPVKPEISHKVQTETAEPRPETPTQRGRPRINTTSLPGTPRNLVDTPTTVVTPPTPTIGSLNAGLGSPQKIDTPRTQKPNSVESIRHRRAQSATLPSRLSNAIPAPLTPTIEETKTPGGTLTQPTVATGFFSSFLTAAQKAADQLSANIVPGTKVKPNTQPLSGKALDERIQPTANKNESTPETVGDGNPRAVDTQGKGELSLNQLGISKSEDHSPMSSSADLLQQDHQPHFDDASTKAEEEAAARAVSVAYERLIQPVAPQPVERPLSVASTERLMLSGDQTPDRSGDAEGLKRSGSVRSKLSGRRRRHRASTATQGTTNSIAAAIQSSSTGLANLTANGTGHRLPGYAVASSKRNKDFHQLFRSVPEDDYLIEDYSAALQRDILLHGRLYVSEGHICFSSNILGWVTNLVIGFDEVVTVEKKNTAVIFPNAIVISTLHARNTFASFVARDSTYELLIGIWKISHPNLKSSLNGVTLDDAGTGDKTEVADADMSDADSADESDDEVYDEDEDDDVGSFTDAGVTASMAGSDIGDMVVSRKTSAAPLTNASAIGISPKAIDGLEGNAPGGATGTDFPGPATHAPTEFSDTPEQYDRPLTDAIIAAPLGKVYSIMFGPNSGAFMRKFFADEKCTEVNYTDDKTGVDGDHKTFFFDYIKPLNGAIGPKQVKCFTTNTLTTFDLEKVVSVDCSTSTPDAPSGNVFTTKTRYCLMWGPGNSTRLIASCTIEWTGKSWLKGPIESGTIAGQQEYVKNIVPAIKAAVVSSTRGTMKKGKRKGKKLAIDTEDPSPVSQSSRTTEQHTSNWGIFEIFKPILDPIFGLVRPFMTLQVFTAVLFTLLMYSWVLTPRGGGSQIGLPSYSSPQRLAAYEAIWHREESELWDWLEDRVGLDGVYAPGLSKEQQSRQRVLAAKGMGKRLEDERMKERQMDEAIRVTEERLEALKDAVKRKRVVE